MRGLRKLTMIEEEHQTISGPVSQQSSRSHRDRQSLCCEEAGKFLDVDVYVVSPLAGDRHEHIPIEWEMCSCIGFPCADG